MADMVAYCARADEMRALQCHIRGGGYHQLFNSQDRQEGTVTYRAKGAAWATLNSR